MNTLMQSVQQTRDAARKVFGDDIEFTLARAPAWGNDDCCILVYGKQHAAAARAFGCLAGATVTADRGGGFMGRPIFSYSIVTFQPSKEAAAS